MTKLFLGAGLLSLSLFACAGDPNKQANDAHDAELKAERKQIENTAEDRSETRVTSAEQQRKIIEANAGGGDQASQETVAADANLAEAQQVYRAKATERLEKLDARTSEVKQRVDRAGGKAPTSARDALKTVETQRSLVTRELDQLPKVEGDAFGQAKTSLETQLDNLEGLVKKAADEAAKIKK